MGKRTPMPLSSVKEDVYIYLHDAGLVFKLRCINSFHNWCGDSLQMTLSKCVVSIAKHKGSSDWIYFPKSGHTHALKYFECTFDNSKEHKFFLELNGVKRLRTPSLPESFDINVSTLSIMRHCDIPAPEYVRIIKSSEKYSVGLTCTRSQHARRYRKPSALDELLESMCTLTGS